MYSVWSAADASANVSTVKQSPSKVTMNVGLAELWHQQLWCHLLGNMDGAVFQAEHHP